MPWHNLANTSLFGRRVGLQVGTTGVTGSARSGDVPDYLVGPADIRRAMSTAESTATNLRADGISIMTSLVSSGVYTIDPPFPGVQKTLVNTSTSGGTWYLKGQNGETFESTQGTSSTVLKSLGTGSQALSLTPISSARWAVGLGAFSTAVFALSTTT